MSERGQITKTYTARNEIRYQITISHKQLNKHQIIKGDNAHIVEQKARATMAQWDELWERKKAVEDQRLARQKSADDKRTQRDQQAKYIEERKQTADEMTRQAQAALCDLETILQHTLGVNDTINWETLKNLQEYTTPPPKKTQPPIPPSEPTIPPEPQFDTPVYHVELNLVDMLIASRRRAKEQSAVEAFKRDHQAWQTTKAQLLATSQQQQKAYQADLQAQSAEYQAAVATWEQDRTFYLIQRDAANAAVDAQKAEYLRGDQGAILDYCDLVLSNSQYPDYFPKSYDLDYLPAKILIIDYQLPAIGDLPTLQEVKYNQSKDELIEKHITAAQLNRYYDSAIYQIALRTIHELYEADQIDALASIAFNGYVTSTDRATGNQTTACILSVQTSKPEFTQLNLAAVDPQACFKSLKGIGSTKLHSLTPIAPILKMDRQDARFVPSYAVLEELQEGDNLAAMDWEDFEHLIRQVFEQEFGSGGGEVKVTRASRDGGVDAIAFDPDPIRGGKIVIQAKRYTGTVTVSFVRDLYGTVVNEGANKGILVTTSTYGPDAYEFARGKPLVLLDGNNLLHLLEKHGHKARIDLQEAKRQLAEKR